MLIIPVVTVSGRVHFVPKTGKGRDWIDVCECCHLCISQRRLRMRICGIRELNFALMRSKKASACAGER